jgi:hypothetical protein
MFLAISVQLPNQLEILCSSYSFLCVIFRRLKQYVTLGSSWMRLDKATAEWQQRLTDYLDSTFGGSRKGGTAPC